MRNARSLARRRAGWSANFKRLGCDVWFLDKDVTAVEDSFDPKPEYHKKTLLVVGKNGLDRRRFIHLDFLDFAMAVIKGYVNVGDLHAIHDGLDCSTFTVLAKSHNQRHPGNAWCGTSKESYATNLRHHYLIALHLFLLKMGSTRTCSRSAENPNAGRQFHPLTVNVVELPKAQGGLGMARLLFSMCHIVAHPLHASMKPSNLWADLKGLIDTFMSEHGEPKKLCSKERPCHYFGSHRHLRPEKGDETVDEKRGSVYPDELCYLLSNAASDLLGRVRTIDLDPAFTSDGSREACTKCGNMKKGGNLYRCDNCPDVWHYGCIPKGWRKPKQSEALWFCGNAACQRKQKELEAQAA